MLVSQRLLVLIVAVVMAGCTEESIIGGVIYQADLTVVQRDYVDPPTNAIGDPTGVPKVLVTVRNAGDGTAYNAHVELRIKQGSTIIETARGTYARLTPGEQARAEVRLSEVDRHSECDTLTCRLHWLDARNRGHSRGC